MLDHVNNEDVVLRLGRSLIARLDHDVEFGDGHNRRVTESSSQLRICKPCPVRGLFQAAVRRGREGTRKLDRL